MPAQRACFALACAFAFLFSCGAPRMEKGTGGGGGAPGVAPETSGAVELAGTAEGGTVGFSVETVAGNLEVPWSIVFAPDGRMLFTERPGRVRVYESGLLRPEPLATIEDVETSSESGLMGLVLHPRFDENRQLYLAYAYKQDGIRVRVVRFRETGTGLAERKLIIEGIPAAQYHAGTRLRFGPDGKLYVTTGDGAQREFAQRLDSLAGKTLRLNDDGTVPPDNPFVNAVFYRGAAFPAFIGNFFFGNLRGECIIRVVLDGRRVVSQERLLEKQYGRIRDVAEGPDGALYFSTSNRDGRGRPKLNDDRIMRLVPQSKTK
ncbi:MAG: PQQ-dependent sugar dehydrogenase [Acidobacteria bacterium]|nr:PQQ-dependent sugar dehydrogenase [Acidobacteriota bacterium]